MLYKVTAKPTMSDGSCQEVTLVVGDQPWNTPRYFLNTEQSSVQPC